jgi:hypothetical protein
MDSTATSPATSLFDRTSSSPLPSPTSSVYSMSSTNLDSDFSLPDENGLQIRPLLFKKKVSFTPNPSAVISVAKINRYSSPPRSPCSSTHRRSNAITLSTIRSALAPSPSINSLSFDCTFTTIRERASSDASVTPTQEQEPETDALELEQQRSDTISSFLLSKSTARYNSHLESLGAQLHYHISTLENLIEETQRLRESSQPVTSDDIASSSTTSKSNKRGVRPDIFDKFENLFIGYIKIEEEAAEERKRLRKERMAAWLVRERFDGRRFQELAEKALRELGY